MIKESTIKKPIYKTYPHFQQRFKIENYEALEGLNLIGGITFEKEYPEGKYYLRTVPSAGALFPCEVYVQIRGIKGMIGGIYHYESKRGILTLIHEIDSDGVEFYFPSKQKQKGFIFLISAIYFRSSWKYRNRSIRYILLDAGHQLGTIYTALYVMNQDLFSFAKSHNIDIFYTLHRVEGVQEGLYKNGTLIKEGNFQEKSRYLSLEQNLGGMSAITFYFTSNEVEKYQKVSILSGFIAHIIYIRCELQGVGCSEIGAYYDDEAKAFLNTPNNILYLLAIGK